MSTEMMLESKDITPNVLWVTPNKTERVKHVRPVELNVGCDENDNEGEFMVIGPGETVTVRKYSSENDKQGMELTSGGPFKFRGNEYFRVSAKFYDESLRLQHKKSKSTGNIGNIAR